MSFCQQRSINPLCPSVAIVLDFLLELYHGADDHSPLGYSAINTARSALSTIVTIENTPAGQHDLVKRFMRAVFNNRPALPRNTSTWDVHIVLDYLKTLSPVRTLSLTKLSKKLLMLLLLLSGQRGQTIHLMDLRNMTLTDSHAKFRIGDLTKTSAPGRHVHELSFKAYAPDRRLCVITSLHQYVKVTKPIRGQCTKLFVTTKKPHCAASRDTIRRWAKDIMTLAGIDMNVFTAHSTRAASTSKAAKFIPLQTILKTATWSNEATFTKYYQKPITNSTFASAVLQ